MLRSLIYNKTIILTAGQILTGRKLPIDEFFLLKKLTSKQTGTFKAKLELDNEDLSRDLIPNTNLFGISTFPMIFTEPGYISENGEITIDIQDTSGAPNTVELTFIGVTGTWKELKFLTKNFLYIPYFYSNELRLAASGDEGSFIINADTDHPFRIIKLIASKGGDFSAEVKINNNSLNRGLMPDTNIFGTAQLPLAVDPYDVKAGGIIQVDFKNGTTVDNDISLCFHGHKVSR